MSFYRLSDGQRNGVDIDNVLYDDNRSQLPEGTLSTDPRAVYGDYEARSRPGVSGSGVVIPEIQDMGIPNFLDNPEPGFEDVRYLKDFLYGDQSQSLDDMLEPVNNGRMGDIENIKDTVLKEESDIVIRKDNQDTSIKGLLEKNSVNDIFFSDDNIKGLQESIRYGVHQETDQVISEQSPNELYVVMRSIMLQFANFRTGIDNIGDEIKRLNQKVLVYCIQNISSNVKQHMGYVKDLSRLPEPMDRPVHNIGSRNYTYDISNLL